MPRTHDPSQGAGHNRPVNSGKLFVAWRRSIAAFQRSRKTRSFQSGIRLPSGHPWWQKGMPQSMQRDACAPQRIAPEGHVDLFPVANPRQHRPRRLLLALHLEKSGGLTHWRPPAAETAGPRPVAGGCAASSARLKSRGITFTNRVARSATGPGAAAPPPVRVMDVPLEEARERSPILPGHGLEIDPLPLQRRPNVPFSSST